MQPTLSTETRFQNLTPVGKCHFNPVRNQAQEAIERHLTRPGRDRVGWTGCNYKGGMASLDAPKR